METGTPGALIENRILAMARRYERGLDIWSGEPLTGEDRKEWVGLNGSLRRSLEAAGIDSSDLESVIERVIPEDRDRGIFRAYYGVGRSSPLTARQVGREYKLSEGRINVVVARCVRIIRGHHQLAQVRTHHGGAV